MCTYLPSAIGLRAALVIHVHIIISQFNSQRPQVINLTVMSMNFFFNLNMTIAWSYNAHFVKLMSEESCSVSRIGS